MAAVAVGTLLLRLPAYVASTHLSFDDGVFGASAVAMRSGGRPFSEVFSSQGPLFLPLVWLGDLIGFRTASSPRVLAVVAGIVLAVATYAMGRDVADRAGARLAAGLVATSIGILGVSGPLAADGPALAAGTVAVALAVRWRGAPSLAHAAAIGAAVGVALSIKSLLAPSVLPVALVLLSWRRLSPVLVGASTAIAVNLAASLPWGWGDVWDQSYAYHLEVAGDRTPAANLAKVLSTLGDRELPLVVAAVLATAVAVGARRWEGARRLARRTERTGGDGGDGRASGASGAGGLASPDLLLGAWLGATLLVLLVEHPMWRPHVAHLVPAGALLVARHRPRWVVLVAAAVVVVPYHVVHAWSLLAPDGYRADTAAVVEALRDLPPGALAISDEPGLVWRAGRRTTDDLVDASMLRIEVGDITSRYLADVAAEPEVCAVAVRSRVRWGSFDDLPERLAAAGYAVALEDDLGRVLYVKSACDP